MKGFLYKLLIFGAIALLTHVIAGYHMNGFLDPYYMRFTPNINTGLVIGNSRSAQGVCPDDIKSHSGLFNASFSLSSSPYGETYQTFLMKQINQESKNQLFIFCVDPWSLSSPRDSISGDDVWFERDKLVATTKSIADPNWEFIIEQYGYGWGNIIKEHYRPTSGMHLHRNGWLEVQREYDEVKSSKRRADKLAGYKKEVFLSNHPSAARKESLKALIKEMKIRGRVLMVRIPIHPDFFELEQTFWPGFESEMYEIAAQGGIIFWSPKELNGQLTYNDGHHMNYKSSHRFSRLLNEKIAAIKEREIE
jgi:hypothetical protein